VIGTDFEPMACAAQPNAARFQSHRVTASPDPGTEKVVSLALSALILGVLPAVQIKQVQPVQIPNPIFCAQKYHIF
jgi:hypothetical protein